MRDTLVVGFLRGVAAGAFTIGIVTACHAVNAYFTGSPELGAWLRWTWYCIMASWLATFAANALDNDDDDPPDERKRGPAPEWARELVERWRPRLPALRGAAP